MRPSLDLAAAIPASVAEDPASAAYRGSIARTERAVVNASLILFVQMAALADVLLRLAGRSGDVGGL